MGRKPMPHSYASIVVHVVFSTKDRTPQLDTALEERLYPYLGGSSANWEENSSL